MGYNLYIGEAAADIDLAERHASICVNAMDGTDIGAPLNSQPGEDRSNVVFPSYTAWSTFAEAVGLDVMFFAGGNGARSDVWKSNSDTPYDGLVARHPGCEEITSDHLEAMKEAQTRWARRPAAAKKLIDGIDYNKRRIDWLVWWTEWSLANCQNPSFYNT